MAAAGESGAGGGVTVSGPNSGVREEYAVAAAATAAEAGLALLTHAFDLRTGALLALHTAIVGTIGYWLWRRRGRAGDQMGSVMLFIATLVTGPLGALGSLIAMPLFNRAPRDSALLAAWYKRISLSTEIDPAVRLANTVAAGRSINANAPVPPPFELVMVRGSLHERQTALGLIARKFHPDYAPALKAALKSQEPVVRVQAAAVAAKLRGELKRRLGELIAKVPLAGGGKLSARALSRDIEALQGTGLLDTGDTARAADAAAELKRLSAARVTPRRAARLSGEDHPVLEADLIAAGRFAELRRLRRARRLAGTGLFRLRVASRVRSEGRA